MCYRFYLKAADLKSAANALGALLAAERSDRYNIAPTAPVSVVRTSAGSARELAELRWGLVPSWSAGPSSESVLANARAETAATKPSFRESLARRRCIIPASGFFEWEGGSAGLRQPWVFERGDGKPLLMAGLWDCWRGREGETIESCTILTTEPNSLVARLHDRMPVVLSETGCEAWLGAGETPPEALYRPFPAEVMQARCVDSWVNSVAHDDERCIRTFIPQRQSRGEQLSLF